MYSSKPKLLLSNPWSSASSKYLPSWNYSAKVSAERSKKKRHQWDWNTSEEPHTVAVSFKKCFENTVEYLSIFAKPFALPKLFQSLFSSVNLKHYVGCTHVGPLLSSINETAAPQMNVTLPIHIWTFIRHQETFIPLERTGLGNITLVQRTGYVIRKHKLIATTSSSPLNTQLLIPKQGLEAFYHLQGRVSKPKILLNDNCKSSRH